MRSVELVGRAGEEIAADLLNVDQLMRRQVHGVDKQKFLAAYNSFANDSMIKRDDQMIESYQIDGVPTIAVQGKYETGPGITNSRWPPSPNASTGRPDAMASTGTIPKSSRPGKISARQVA